MKKFFKNSLLFVLVIIVLAIPMDIFISEGLKKGNNAWGEYNTWSDIYDSQVDAELVIYGSSRAWRHIDPKIIENKTGISSYNLGIDGHNFWLQHLRHKTFLEENTKPKYIILSVDIWSLKKGNELYNAEQFLPYMLFDKDIFDYTNSYKGFSIADYYLPLIRYIGNKNAVVESLENSFSFKKLKLKRKKGYQGWNKVWNTDFSEVKKKMKFFEAIPDPVLISLFDDFLSECAKKDIKVVLVYTPEYFEGQNFVKNRKEIISLFEGFSDKNNIPFLDYSSNSICTKKEFFYNASHLNKKGAEAFTSLLVNDLIDKKIIQ